MLPQMQTYKASHDTHLAYYTLIQKPSDASAL